MNYAYYPGCSLESTACEFNASVVAVFKALEVGLHEMEDWNCCGASSAHSVNQNLALALPTRNLAIAQKSGMNVVMPCAACFNRHKTADHTLRNDPEKRSMLEEMVGFNYTGDIAVLTLLEVVGKQIGLERVRSLVKKPLSGLKAVSYYGCLLVRPPEITQFEDPDNPQIMDHILEALGAEPRTWSYATDCCGGGLSLTKPTAAARMVGKLADRAQEAGAQAIVTSCPLCQINLEMRQSGSKSKMPIFFITELLGLAFGLEDAKGWMSKHLISPTTLLKDLNIL
ncbi:MAG: CoB--CoM heterodisulfide reductase iron-sulfur subunit B family protein [Anaerolineales bacterium]|nr:CoB--CoM heterodisulfide reductase iron-sulfur subunit B family protein [Anaerolineales bacterium]